MPVSSRRSLDADAANVMRQALAGMLWSKQFFYYDVDRWLEERGSDPFKPSRQAAPRNEHWHHMYNADVISMPDKWEYPWYAAWDLAFHVLPLTLVDRGFRQAATRSDVERELPAPERPDPGLRMELRRRESAGASPGPPSSPTAWKRRARARGTSRWLKTQLSEAAAQLHLVGQSQGSFGQERLRGGVPGPGQHRRVRPQFAAADRGLPRTGRRHGLDGPLQPEHARDRRRTGLHDPTYADMATQVRPSTSSGLPRRPSIAGGNTGMWDEEDGFFYDVLRLPNGQVPAPEGPLHGGAAAALCGHGLRQASFAKYPEIAEELQASSRPARN